MSFERHKKRRYFARWVGMAGP